MSTSSELIKRKQFNNITSNSPPFKKQKVSFSINRNYSFPSIICVDYEKEMNQTIFSNCFTLCISNDKDVYSIGSSCYSSHGHENEYIFSIKQINNLANIKLICCGSKYTICLSYSGDIFSFGTNDSGQLGIGSDDIYQTYIPQKINLPLCKQVSCGNQFTICITDDNKLYSFGKNKYGQLAMGNNLYKFNSPQLILYINNIEYIVCGGYYCICKTYNNEFYSWGSNGYGQLGQGDNKESCNKPIKCLNWPDNIISIKCGYDHSLLLTSEGQVYSFGDNTCGQLGINDKNIETLNTPTLIKDIPEIQRIECGYYRSLCIDINNNLWVFGRNYCGQLGLGETEYKYKPILHPTLSNIIDISSGGNHTFVKTIDNKIYAFGNNEFNQLGIKTSERNQLTPIQVFQNNEDKWCSFIGKSKQKSARK